MNSRSEPANLGFDDGVGPDGRPSEWGGGGQGYELGVDRSGSASLGAAGRIRFIGQRVRDEDFGTLTQCFDAGGLRGAVICFSGYVKTADVQAAGASGRQCPAESEPQIAVTKVTLACAGPVRAAAKRHTHLPLREV